jgi:hypothetical protein
VSCEAAVLLNNGLTTRAAYRFELHDDGKILGWVTIENVSAAEDAAPPKAALTPPASAIEPAPSYRQGDQRELDRLMGTQR